MPQRVGSLYVCYLTITDPLVETQVVAYLAGLAAAGHRIHLVTFEPKNGMNATEERDTHDRLAARGITWHRARYRKRPSLPATVLDSLLGALRISRLVRQHKLDLVHARSHVPAAMALLARRLRGTPFIFDIRGLMAEEYVDAGRWKAGGLPFRITKSVERRAIAASSGAVVLTEGARRLLLSDPGSKPVEVIPCCVDLRNFDGSQDQSKPAANPTFAYVGKFGGWYMDTEMAQVFAQALRRWPGARLRVLTQSDRAAIEQSLDDAGVASDQVSIGSVPAHEIGRELESATVGLSLVRPVPSKVASSPTKNAEYLAAGLPLLATAGVAGTDDLAQAFPGTVVSMDSFDADAIELALADLGELMADPATSGRCLEAARSFSLEERGVPSYVRLYGAVASAIGKP